ncbi:uncharacterized protein [Spinacia oleracea]|uniref:Uncharacterized protein isoform X2 n=1 Tax=Spinacia oleracea TaxID=3562 RepID=A0A9R0K573_SPIOL|nr:uncharacterized protein LOC110798079 isoform X2 [Spinacia oleracea]
MEIDKTSFDHIMEEYILLDLDAVYGQVAIPPDEAFILSKLDTMNPVLTIGNNLKLIGEYEETIGTCLIFSEKEKALSSHEETGSTEANNSKNDGIVDPNTGSSKHIRPVTSLHKILKFRLLSEVDGLGSTEKPPDPTMEN